MPIEDTVREILNYLRSITVTSFVGGTVQTTSSGTTLTVAAKSNPAPSDAHLEIHTDGETFLFRNGIYIGTETRFPDINTPENTDSFFIEASLIGQTP